MLYDICDIFIYRKYIRKWIYAKYFVTNWLPDGMVFLDKEDVKQYLDEYNIDININELYKKIYPNYYDDISKVETMIQLYITSSQKNFNMTLIEYIFKYYDDRIRY